MCELQCLVLATRWQNRAEGAEVPVNQLQRHQDVRFSRQKQKLFSLSATLLMLARSIMV